MGKDKLLNGFNVSGHGGFYTYKIASQIQLEMEGNFTRDEAQQVLFHTIFGTYKEDLSVLGQITGLGNWNTREEFGDKFQKMSTGGKSVKFTPIPLLYYSKLASANQTSLLATSYLQVCSITVFSGRRKQNFTEVFLEQISKRSGAISSAKTIPHIIATLTELLSSLSQKLIGGGKRLSMGTVTWRSMEDINIEAGGSELNFEAEGTCKFFLGKS